MERIQVLAQPRTRTTKGQLRELRSSGFVPAIIYGRKSEPTSIAVESKDIHAILHSPTGTNTIIELSVADEKTTVIMKSMTRDILLADRVTHVDFLRISLMDKLEVQVPVILVGEPAGVKAGGVLQHALREVTLECLPTNIAEHIELDVSGLAIGESLTVADLVVPEGAEFMTDPSEVVVTIISTRAETTAGTDETGTAPLVAEAKQSAAK